MLREAIPEKDWTPAQREQMRGWERLWSRDRQWLRVGNWKSRQIRTHDWVSLDAIADWCARKPGDIERDDKDNRREDDLLDTFCYGIALSLGNQDGF
jgi:hypothetical protein